MTLGEVSGTAATGWTVRLRVRAEHVEVEKQTLVREEAVVRRGEVRENARVEAEQRHEELRILEQTQPMGVRQRKDAFEPPYEI